MLGEGGGGGRRGEGNSVTIEMPVHLALPTKTLILSHAVPCLVVRAFIVANQDTPVRPRCVVSRSLTQHSNMLRKSVIRVLQISSAESCTIIVIVIVVPVNSSPQFRTEPSRYGRAILVG